MIESYFNIRYNFLREEVYAQIDRTLDQNKSGYICVADGNILTMVNNNPEYAAVVDGAMFSICDSSFVPLYLKSIYGIQREQFCGSQIFENTVRMKKYRQFFMGGSSEVLQGLKDQMMQLDPRIADMTFFELPFKDINDFDYKEIAKIINEDKPEIIWVALGAPKQERFMSKLLPYLDRGVMIGVGAVFNFYCGVHNAPKRAPEWMVKAHMEFIYRLFTEPKKQFKRCWGIVSTLPSIYIAELSRKHKRIHS